MKNKSNYFIGMIILLLLFIFTRSVYNFVVYFISIDPITTQNEILSKIVPPLLGAFFSGIVAVIIFYLTKLKEEVSKKNQSKMYLDIITTEIQDNLNSVEFLSDLIIKKSSDELASLLKPGTPIQEQFKVVSSSLTTEVIDKFLIQLNKEDFLKIANKTKKFKLLISSLDMLNNDIKEQDNKALLIERLKKLFEFFSTKDTEEMTGKFYSLENKKLLSTIVILLICSTVLYSVLNIFFIKFIL